MSQDQAVIKVQALWKQYGLPLPPILKRARAALAGGGSAGADAGPWALREIDLDVGRAEVLGVIGRNGSGKSTLLKVLAGVTPPTRGRVEVRGRVFPMIELNAGLNTELSGRENVYVLGAIMGLSTRDVNRLMPSVESFCDLGGWFDRPVRKYSTGMLARLGFAVAMYVPAEILLIDEVIAVGDLNFRKKCFDRIHQLKAAGTTMLFVSHNPYEIERLCNRVVCLDQGRALEVGESRLTLALYHDLISEDKLPAARAAGAAAGDSAPVSETRPGSGEVRVDRVSVLDADGKDANTIESGSPMTIRLEYTARQAMDDVWFRLEIISPAQVVVASMILPPPAGGSRIAAGPGWVECRILAVPLLSDSYWVDINLDHNVLVDWWPRAARLHVTMRDPEALRACGAKGMVFLPAEWTRSG